MKKLNLSNLNSHEVSV